MILKRTIFVLSMLALLAAVIPGVTPVAAQASSLTQVIATRDGALSLRVPDGWVSYDGSNDPQIPLFTSQLWFGDTSEALNTRLAYNRSGSGTIVGLGGGAFLTNTSLYQQSFGEAATAAGLLDVLLEFNRSAGFEVQDPVETVVDGNAGFFAVVDSTSFNDERGLLVTLDTPTGVVLVIASGTSSNVVENADLLAGIAETLRTPAEQSVQPTPTAQPTTPPLITPVAGTTDGGITDYSFTRTISDEQSRISIALPSAWLVENHLENETGAIIFGDSQAAIDSRIRDFDTPGGDVVVGVGGSMAFVGMDEFGISNPTPVNYAVDLMTDIGAGYVEDGAEIILEATDFEVFGGNSGALLGVSWPSGQTGWAAFFTVNQENTAVFILLSADTRAGFDAQYVELASLVDTVRLPADVGAEPILPFGEEPVVAPVDNNTQGPGLGDVFNNSNSSNPAATNPTPSTSALPDGLAVYRADDGRFSIRLPEGWVAADTISLDSLFVVAESQAALTSRQDGFDVISRTASLEGTGVIIIPYTLSDYVTLGQVPAQFALNAINSQVESWTEAGGIIVFPATELLNENGVQVARAGGISGLNGEAGFIAFVVIEDANLVLYISASSESSAAFTEDVFVLEAALLSIVAPAE